MEKQKSDQLDNISEEMISVKQDSSLAENNEAQEVISPFYIHPKTEVETIKFTDSFHQLTYTEKMYAYYMTRAAWAGLKIGFFQIGYESPAIFYFIIKIFTLEPVEEVKSRLILQSGFSEEDWKNLTLYIGGVLQYCGNYLGFGATKFIPKLSPEKFSSFITDSVLVKNYPKTLEMWDQIKTEIYLIEDPYGRIGLSSEGGLTGYYSPNLTRKEIEWLQKIIVREKISEINTRLLKTTENDYIILVASSKSNELNKTIMENDKKIKIEYCHFQEIMQQIVDYLKRALDYCSNENQKETLNSYIKHFMFGDMEDHRTAQIHWIKDKGPIVETNIGFLTKYTDPLNMRGEYIGWVAIQDKEKSKILAKFVERGEEFIRMLPWPKEFEKDKFLLPDFISLETIAFACFIVPLGMNLPMYDDIKQTYGSKNFYYSNGINNTSNSDLLKYTTEDRASILINLSKEIKFVNVTLHELLGHGCGKVFMESEDGSLNFDKNTVKLLNGDPITSWYVKGETYYTKFSDMSMTIEECRAEAVSLYLVCFDEVIKCLYPEATPEWIDELRYGSWISMFMLGLRALEYFTPPTKKWGQAHMQARYVILNYLLQHGDGVVKISREGDGNPRVIVDRTKILNKGKEALGNFMIDMQIQKTTGNLDLKERYIQLSQVSQELVEAREVLMRIKSPRKFVILNDLYLKGDAVEVMEFENNFEGLIKSHLMHYQHDAEIMATSFSQYQKIMQYSPLHKQIVS